MDEFFTNTCLLPKRNDKQSRLVWCQISIESTLPLLFSSTDQIRTRCHTVISKHTLCNWTTASRSWNVSKFVCLRAKIQINRLSNVSHSFMTLCVKIKITQRFEAWDFCAFFFALFVSHTLCTYLLSALGYCNA